MDPLRDARMLELELILADLGAVERRLERLDQHQEGQRARRTWPSASCSRASRTELEAERPLRELELSEDDRRKLRSYSLLTEKPMLLVVNLGEEPHRGRGRRSSSRRASRAWRRAAAAWAWWPVSAPIEAEMAQLSRRGRARLPRGPGPHRARPRPRGPHLLRAAGPHLLPHRGRGRVPGLDHPRRGTRAQQAAGTIHSDIERGFIRAEVVAFDDLMAAGSIAACRDKGTLRLEGKEYVVRDGDVINFRFNV